MIPQRLGKLLIQAKLITEEDLRKATELQRTEGGRLGSILVKLGLLTEQQLLTFLSLQYSVPHVDLHSTELDHAAVQLIPAEVAHKYRVAPIKKSGASLTLAMEDPTNVFAIDDIKFMTGYNIIPVIASEGAINDALNKHYDSASLQFDHVLKDLEMGDDLDILEDKTDETISLSQLKAEVDEAPVVRLANILITEAIKKGASDIHIEAYEKRFRIRYRIDGTLYEAMEPPMRLKNALTSRIKIMANLDIAERRLPQDGRMKLKAGRKEVDLRVSILPCLFGEKIVMRILDKGALSLGFAKLGFEPKAQSDFLKAIEAPFGMILVTGPTGSGKSTTLYSALQYLNKPDTNIMTAEDPVEFNVAGINQVQMKEAIGLTFSAALRSFLRQDPDVILVGEIRDYETAEIAVKAALTGHLVLSTLHTNDAAGTVTRLLNMGIEPFLVASSLILIVAQRLVRRTCLHCKEVDKVPGEVLEEAGFSAQEAKHVVPMRGQGCDACSKSGFKGRVALYEVLPISETIRTAILQGATADEVKKAAVREGMRTLRVSGLAKIREGITTIDEVVKTTFRG